MELLIARMVSELKTEDVGDFNTIKKLEIVNKMLSVAIDRRKGKQGNSWVVGKSNDSLEAEFE